jgi:hypothetical protein
MFDPIKPQRDVGQVLALLYVIFCNECGSPPTAELRAKYWQDIEKEYRALTGQ